MILTARSRTLSVSSPGPVFYGLAGGLLADVEALEYQIFDVSTAAKMLEPVQVYPSIPGNRAAVDLVVDRIGVGRFAATWAVPADEPAGEHAIKWFYRHALADPELEAVEFFEVLAGLPLRTQRVYASPSSVRAEEICDVGNDVRLLGLLARAARFIEMVTHRTFSPNYRVAMVDGTNRSVLRFDDPIIALADVSIDSSTIDLSGIRVYARHLSEGLIHPDDRDNPRIMFSDGASSIIWSSPFGPYGSSSAFRRAPQSVAVAGVFGYTDPSDDVPWGVTPDDIAHLSRLLVARQAPLIGDAVGRAVLSGQGQITSERTRDQSVTYGTTRADAFAEGWTGDPEIDELLARYSAPPFVGTT